MANLIQIQVGLYTVDITKESVGELINAVDDWFDGELPPDLFELSEILIGLTIDN